MAVKVVFSTGAKLAFTGGQKEFEFEAKSLREVIRELEAQFPGIREFLEEETTVAIDGQIYETAYYQPLNENSEVYFLPKIEAG